MPSGKVQRLHGPTGGSDSLSKGQKYCHCSAYPVQWGSTHRISWTVCMDRSRSTSLIRNGDRLYPGQISPSIFPLAITDAPCGTLKWRTSRSGAILIGIASSPGKASTFMLSTGPALKATSGNVEIFRVGCYSDEDREMRWRSDTLAITAQPVPRPSARYWAELAGIGRACADRRLDVRLLRRGLCAPRGEKGTRHVPLSW